YSPFQVAGSHVASPRIEAEPAPQLTLSSPSVASLIRALEVAADRTATSIAHGTKQARVEVRERLNEVISWLTLVVRSKAEDPTPVPPVIAREYVSTLKV